MKFAHLADCHIGGWKEDELKSLGLESFYKAIDKCIDENVAFILISGDLFNNALPSIDILKKTASILRKAKSHNISTYIIPGSHDFSPSGKTMLDVLEKAGLLSNVMKFKDNKLQFTVDKTNVKITGLLGRRAGLEVHDYKALEKYHLENEEGFKIFMFHTALEEFKPEELKEMDAQGVAVLPKKFNYYAGGHVHYIFKKEHENGMLAYPGPVFPNNFKELEDLKHGGFYIVDDKLNIEYMPLMLKDVLKLKINADEKTPEEVEERILEEMQDYKDKIVLLRIGGTLKNGRPSDINFKNIYEKGKEAYSILKNINKLTTKEFEEAKMDVGKPEEVEKVVINEHLQQSNTEIIKDEETITCELMNVLNKEKYEGEKNLDFEKRIVKDAILTIGLADIWAKKEDETAEA